MTHIHMIQLFSPIPASEAGGLLQTASRERSPTCVWVSAGRALTKCRASLVSWWLNTCEVMDLTCALGLFSFCIDESCKQGRQLVPAVGLVVWQGQEKKADDAGSSPWQSFSPVLQRTSAPRSQRNTSQTRGPWGSTRLVRNFRDCWGHLEVFAGYLEWNDLNPLSLLRDAAATPTFGTPLYS